MTCDLLDLPCHAITGAFRLWDSIGWGWQLMAVIGFGLIVLGAVWNFGRIVKAVAGWPGMAGLAILAVTIGGAILSGLRSVGKSKPDDDFRGDVAGSDAEPPFRPQPRKRPTIADAVRKTFRRPKKR